MKKPVFVLTLLLSLASASQALALEVTVYGRNEVLYKNDTFVRANESVEHITQRTVGQEQKIRANEHGITAIGELEQDTSSSTRADGWCYAVDGKMPAQGYRELKLSNQSKTLVWFFGHAEKSSDGQWTECTPYFADSTTILK